MNTADYVLLIVIAALIFLAVRYAVKHRHQCGGSCSSCPYGESCGRKKRK